MGTTSDKLTYLSGTKDKLKTAINYTGANITNDTFRSYPEKLYNEYIDIINNGTDTLYANMPKVTGTGTNLTLNNTKEAPVLLSLYGDTQQDSTPTPSSPQEIHNVSGDNTIEICGKNIAKSKYVDSTTTNYAKVLFVEFEIKPNTTYTFSFNGTSGNIVYFNENIFTTSPYITFGSSRAKATITTKSEIPTSQYTANKGWAICKNAAGNTSANVFDDLQVEKGSSASEYEAYKGQSQLISLGVENLFDISTITTGKTINQGTGNVTTDASNRDTSDFIKVKPNTQYTCSTTMTRYAYYDENKTFKNFYTGGTTITTNSDTQYIRFSYDNSLTNIQFEKGTKKNSFTPYGVQPIELCKIGNYQDYIYKTDKWYLHKEIGKVVLDGSETIIFDGSTSTPSQRSTFRITISNNPKTTDYISNRFIKGSSTSNRLIFVANNNKPYISLEDAITGINTSDSNTEKINKLKSWLSTHNTIVYYVLATPTDTEITDTTLLEQLETIKRSYDGVTNISQENNDLPFIITASAIKEYE